jgi:hypothetical protein
MNHFELKPGHAFSVAAGEPHAYITGGEKFLQVLVNALNALCRHHRMYGGIRQHHCCCFLPTRRA